MTISNHQIRVFIVLIIIERALNTIIPQHILDHWNSLTSSHKHIPYEIDLLDFQTINDIPPDTAFIQFKGNRNNYDFNEFEELWLDMTTYDSTLTERLKNAD